MVSSGACSGSRGSRSVSSSASSTRRPARRPRAVGDLVVGPLGDDAALAAVARDATVVTYEWEGVPADAARFLAADLPVHPGARSLEVSQDRLTEKETFRRLGIATPAFAPVDDRAGLDGAVDAVGGLPAVLKTRRGGYDGKGQRVLRDRLGARRRVGRARRRPADPRVAGAVRPGAVGAGGARARRRGRVLAAGGEPARGRDPAGEPGPGAGRRRRAAGPRARSSPVACSPISITSACSRSSCSTWAASCSPTRSRRGSTTRATGPSRARRPASSRTTCARSSGSPLGSTAPAGPSAMLNCIGEMPDRDAVLVGARRPPPRLRQGAAPRPQARARHRHRRRRRRAHRPPRRGSGRRLTPAA